MKEQTTSRSARRPGALGALIVTIVVALMAAGPALADKLIIFKNGKVMRVKEVTEENGWTLATVGKDNTVGVRSTEIARIERAAGDDDEKGSLTPNMASTEGRGVSRGPVGGASRGDDGGEIASTVQERLAARRAQRDEQMAEQAEEARKEQENQPSPPGIPGGLRPLQSFTSGAQGRGFRRSRNTSSALERNTGGRSVGRRGAAPPRSNAQDQQEEEEEDDD